MIKVIAEKKIHLTEVSISNASVYHTLSDFIDNMDHHHYRMGLSNLSRELRKTRETISWATLPLNTIDNHQEEYLYKVFASLKNYRIEASLKDIVLNGEVSKVIYVEGMPNEYRYLVDTEVLNRFEGTDFESPSTEEQRFFAQNHIYKLYDFYGNNYQEISQPNKTQVFTFDVSHLNLTSSGYDVCNIAKQYFPEYSEKIIENNNMPQEGDITAGLRFNKEGMTVDILLLQATGIAYDIVYGFYLGKGVDGGFGDYCSPVFTHPYISEGQVVYVKTMEEAKQVAERLNEIWTDRFDYVPYSGDFPMEVNIVPLTIPHGFTKGFADVDATVSAMINEDSNDEI